MPTWWTTPQSGYLVSPSHDNSGLYRTVSVPVKGAAVPVERLGTFRHWPVPRGETQMMSQIIESCPFTKLNGGLSQLHSADADAIAWCPIMDLNRIRKSLVAKVAENLITSHDTTAARNHRQISTSYTDTISYNCCQQASNQGPPVTTASKLDLKLAIAASWLVTVFWPECKSPYLPASCTHFTQIGTYKRW